MDKIRREIMKERKIMDDILKSGLIERNNPLRPRPPPTAQYKKMVIDPVKLEETIRKACIPVPRKTIQLLDKPPPPPVVRSESSSAKVVVACKAINLNGTPCKCRAKIGKFCAKHAS